MTHTTPNENDERTKHTVIVYELLTAEVEVEAASLEEAKAIVAADVQQHHHDNLLNPDLGFSGHWELEDDGIWDDHAFNHKDGARRTYSDVVPAPRPDTGA